MDDLERRRAIHERAKVLSERVGRSIVDDIASRSQMIEDGTINTTTTWTPPTPEPQPAPVADATPATARWAAWAAWVDGRIASNEAALTDNLEKVFADVMSEFQAVTSWLEELQEKVERQTEMITMLKTQVQVLEAVGRGEVARLPSLPSRAEMDPNNGKSDTSAA
jgi:hypothetical protein